MLGEDAGPGSATLPRRQRGSRRRRRHRCGIRLVLLAPGRPLATVAPSSCQLPLFRRRSAGGSGAARPVLAGCLRTASGAIVQPSHPRSRRPLNATRPPGDQRRIHQRARRALHRPHCCPCAARPSCPGQELVDEALPRPQRCCRPACSPVLLVRLPRVSGASPSCGWATAKSSHSSTARVCSRGVLAIGVPQRRWPSGSPPTRGAPRAQSWPPSCSSPGCFCSAGRAPTPVRGAAGWCARRRVPWWLLAARVTHRRRERGLELDTRQFLSRGDRAAARSMAVSPSLPHLLLANAGSPSGRIHSRTLIVLALPCEGSTFTLTCCPLDRRVVTCRCRGGCGAPPPTRRAAAEGKDRARQDRGPACRRACSPSWPCWCCGPLAITWRPSDSRRPLRWRGPLSTSALATP